MFDGIQHTHSHVLLLLFEDRLIARHAKSKYHTQLVVTKNITYKHYTCVNQRQIKGDTYSKFGKLKGNTMSSAFILYRKHRQNNV